jgi:hypothetical protein
VEAGNRKNCHDHRNLRFHDHRNGRDDFRFFKISVTRRFVKKGILSFGNYPFGNSEFNIVPK